MIEQAIDDIVELWKYHYTITPRDKRFLSIPVRGKFNGVNYGIYCGPMTNPVYAEGYESEQPYGDPIDGLDFLCYLHDKFFADPIVDDLFVRSIDILNSNKMIGEKVNINGTKNLLTIMRRAFNVWRILWRG